MAAENQEDDLEIKISPREDVKPEFPFMKKLILMSRVINMWPSTKKDSILYHIGVWLVTINCISHVLGYVIKILKDHKDMDSITEFVDMGTVMVSATFRYFYIYVRREKYLLIVSLMHNNFIHYSLFQTKNRQSIIGYYNIANKLILGYITFTFSWVLQLIFMPAIKYAWKSSKLLFDSNGTLTEPIPYPIIMKSYAPFDYTTQPGNAVFYVYQVIGYTIFTVIYMAVDSFWYMVILLTSAQFILLKGSINTISEILKKNESTEGYELLKENQSQNLEEGLKCCIRQHQFTRQFVSLIESISNPIVLVDSLHILLSAAFLLLDVVIALNLGDWNKVMISLQYFITSSVHFFFFNWLGNELTAKEEELTNALYEVSWYRCPKQKHLFLQMMNRSARPQKLTGGKVYKLSLPLFTSMARSVFSYFTFLLEIRN